MLTQKLGYNIPIGRQVLFVIGIDEYEQWGPLKHPVRDAKEIRSILTSRNLTDQALKYNHLSCPPGFNVRCISFRFSSGSGQK